MANIDTAKRIATLKKTIDKNTEALKALSVELIDAVGDEGETFSTTLGQVQVTQRTLDRTTNDISTTFDLDKFLALDPVIQAQIKAYGIVTQERKVVKGQAPKVVVRLR